MKRNAKRWLLMAVCAAAIVPLAAIPLGWFALTDAAMVNPMVQRSTPRSLPKSPPPRVSRMSTMDRGYRNMSTGVE